ncbi:hypothetical protein [Parafrankia discariae]|uniref:hypothetical protein n=1 Tax=Parafrankia discariae TaxID=365528 RepID=UPI0003A7B6B0|nr:hypothetical protein [Parafrankia discariae]
MNRILASLIARQVLSLVLAAITPCLDWAAPAGLVPPPLFAPIVVGGRPPSSELGSRRGPDGTGVGAEAFP